MKNIKIHHMGMKRHIKNLRDQGFSEDQMDAVFDLICDVLNSHINDMATRSDIKIIREKLDKIELRLVIKLGGIISFWASVLATLMKV